MFTGIVEEVGKVVRFGKRGKSAVLAVWADKVVASLKEGDSINVDGVCLTVISKDGNRFNTEVSQETLRRSTIRTYRVGSRVNLERPVSPTGFMGGHIVQGHVDATVKVVSLRRVDDHADLEVEVSEEYLEYIVPKGSIALNGVSLTVARALGEKVLVALIPTTLRETNLGKCKRGDVLNMELDIIGKYVKSFVKAYTG